MIIIFEGPDKTGKTSIAQKLSEVTSIPYFKFELEKEIFNTENAFFNLLKYGFPLLVQFLKQTKTDVILDRSYPSEIVYSLVFNRKTDPSILKWADKQFKEMGAVVVLCYKDKVTEQDEIIDSNYYEEIKEAYMNLKLEIPIYYLNTTDQNLEKQIQFLQKNFSILL